MKWALIAGFVLVLAFVVFEILGRRQPSSLLVSRAALRYCLELLRTRGVDGTALVVQLPERRWELVVLKRWVAGEEVSFILKAREATSNPQRVDLEGSAARLLGDGLQVAGSIDDVISQLDLAANTLGSRLFPGSSARFRGPVLAFNIPRETGISE